VLRQHIGHQLEVLENDLGFLWWLIGASTACTLEYFDQPEYFTWSKLTLCLLVGFLGPVIAIVLGFLALSAADFWDKPVFGKRK